MFLHYLAYILVITALDVQFAVDSLKTRTTSIELPPLHFMAPIYRGLIICGS